MAGVSDGVPRAGAAWTVATDGVPEAERLDRWSEELSTAFVPVDVRRMCMRPFRAALRADRLGPATIVRVRSTAVGIARTAAHVAVDPGGVLFLGVAAGAARTVAHRGRIDVAGPGDVMLLDPGVPFQQTFSAPFAYMSFMIPREFVAGRVATAHLEAVTRIRGGDGLGGLLAGKLRNLADHAGSVDMAAGRMLADQLVDVLALSVGRAAGPAPARGLLLQAALDAVEGRLRDPDLAPAVVARHLCVSVRHLHGLFADHGTTFGRWVLRRRLEHSHRDLVDPAWAHCTVGEVATMWGFRDASHFARVFRDRYGVSPREHRRARGG